MQGFSLNAVLLVVLLGLIFNLGKRLCAPYGGYLGVGLMATVPLLVVNATSSGFDLLNIVMILILAERLEAYLRQPDALRLNLLLLVTVLLAQTRYESVLFIIPVAVAILYVWMRDKEVRITKTMIFVPLMFIVFALQRQMMNEFETFWQLPEGMEHPFGAQFLSENLHIALNFFFHSNDEYPNSLLLTIFFIVAVAVLAYSVVRRRGGFCTLKVRALPWLGVGLIIAANFMLLMAYHWGHLDDPVAARLALPILLAECVLVLFVFGIAALNRRWQLALGAVMLAYFVCWTRPLYARTDFFEWNVRSVQCDYLLDVSNNLKGRERSLILSEIGIVPAIAQTSTLPVKIALDNYDKLDLHMRLHTFDAIYVVYLLKSKVDYVTSDYFPEVDVLKQRLEARFVMQTLDEIKINDTMYMRLARVESVRIDASARYEIDMDGVGINVDGELIDPAQGLAGAFVESLPR
jgi:hypothetical protein